MAITQAGMDAALAILDATVFLEAHDGAPGADGSTNQALGSSRPSIAFGAAETDGGTGRQRRGPTGSAITLGDPGAATYQAWSVHSADTGGTCYWVIPFDTNRTLSAGDDLRAPVNGITCTIAPAPAE
jgi:hypothetical protein